MKKKNAIRKMFEKIKLKRKIKKIIKDIEIYEQKRTRSQASLIETILTKTTPNDKDVSFFNYYTDKINYLRVCLNETKKQLEDLNSKK